MMGQDVFSLAAAAGRGGEEFEARAEVWRQGKSALRGGRSVTASPTVGTLADLQVSHTAWGGLGLDSGEKYRPPPPPSRARDVDFTPVGQNRAPRVSDFNFTPSSKTSPRAASSAALRAFLNAKGDDPLQPSDLRVIESLTEGLRSESQPTGGWSAGIHASENIEATPQRSFAAASVSTPGSVFSMGSTPLPSRAAAAASRKVTYLGPGMSPRRLYGKPRAPYKPLFNFDGSKDQMAGKKRRTDVPEVEVVDSEDEESTKDKSKTASSRSSSESPALSAAASVAAAFNASTRRPSPLSQNNVRSPERDFVKEGKKRAADTLQELYDSEIAPMEPSKPQILFNPYEASAPSLPTKPLHSSLRRSTSGMRMSLRSSTPSRGAAKEIEQLKGSTRKLTTLEMVSGFKPGKATASTTPEREEREEVEAFFGTPNASTPAFSKPPPAKTPEPIPIVRPSSIEEPEPFKPLPTPSLSSSTLGAFRSKTEAPKPYPDTETSITDSILSAAKPKPGPTFNPEPVKLTPPSNSETNFPSNVPAAPAIRSSSNAFNPTAIFLSAKDSALDIEKTALPFFTFTLPSVGTGPSEAVRESALKQPREEYHFVGRKNSLPLSRLTPPSKTTPLLQPTPEVPMTSNETWECSLCMLKNPSSATEKCTICEAPRPGAKIAAPAPPSVLPSAPTGGFVFGAKSATQTPASSSSTDTTWTCDVCMLKNPGSAKEQCTICEAPKPGTKSAAPSGPPAPPSVPSGGFSFGTKSTVVSAAGSSSGAEWTCDLCMLKNPSSATEKCTVCEAPKPGAKPAAPPSLPSVPSGGFSFGAKPSTSSAPSTGEQWTCDVCMLKNPSTAVEQCTICEAPKPGAPPAASSGPPAPPAGGFSFAAPPAPPAGGFTFGGKPVAAPSSSSSIPSTGGFKPAGLPAPPAGGFSFGAKAPAPSLSKPTGEGTWTCSTCMLQNPSSATEQCTICEAKR